MKNYSHGIYFDSRLLPHSLVSPEDDVALIVKDLKKGRRTDYEPTVEHFRQLLDEHKCKQVKTIIPVNQLKTEYDRSREIVKRNVKPTAKTKDEMRNNQNIVSMILVIVLALFFGVLAIVYLGLGGKTETVPSLSAGRYSV